MANMYESLSQSEKDTLRRLQAKAKRVQRQDKAFWQWVDDHAAEIRAHLGDAASSGSSNDNYWFEQYEELKPKYDELKEDIDKLQLVADDYGCSLPELFDWIRQQNQIDYYKRRSTVASVHPTTGGETL